MSCFFSTLKTFIFSNFTVQRITIRILNLDYLVLPKSKKVFKVRKKCSKEKAGT